MRILIADDHPLYVEGLRNLLSNDFEIVGSVSTGLEAVEMARFLKPDVILMDINMPVLDGIAATSQIISEQPQIKVLILTSFEETEKLFRAIKSGAVGYLLKSLAGEEIIAGLYDLEKDKNPFAPGLEARILQEFRTYQLEYQLDDHKDVLSERQFEVLELVAKGLGYAEVGKRLFISERTVKYHMAKIREVLQLSNHEQVVAWAWQHNIGRIQ